MKTVKSGSIASNFPTGVVSEIWCYRTAAFSENEDSEGRFESTRYSEGCCFRKLAV